MTANRVAPGVPTGGQFTPDSRPRSTVALSRDEDPALDAIAQILSDNCFGDEPALSYARQFLEATDAAGISREQAVEYAMLDRNVNQDMTIELHRAGVSAADYQLYRELDSSISRYDAASLSIQGVTAQRLQQVMREHGLPSRSARDIAVLDDAQLADWVSAVRAKRITGRYSSASGIVVLAQAGMTSEEAAGWSGVLSDPRHAVLAARAGLTSAQVTDYRKSSGINNDDAMLGYAAAGVPATEAKAFGSRFTPDQVVALHESGVPGKVAKSLRNADRLMTPERIAELHQAGVTTGAEWQQWAAAEVTSATDIRTMKTAGLPADRAAGLRKLGMPTGLLVEAHRHLGEDPRRWLGRAQARANQSITGGKDAALRAMVTFAAAGGTPEQLGRQQRAGIPIGSAVDALEHEHAGGDVWVYGAPHRVAVLADEAARRDRWGSLAGPAEPWPWDEQTYAQE